MPDLHGLANSTASTVISRLVIVCLPFLIGVVGYFALDKLTTVTETQKAFWGQIGKINGTLGNINTTLATASANYAAHVKDDDNFTAEFKRVQQDHEQRTRVLERAIPAIGSKP